MTPRLPLVDLQCHLLPDCDDGAADWGEALRTARLAFAEGTGTLAAAARQSPREPAIDAAWIRRRTAQLQAQFLTLDLPLTIVPAGLVELNDETPGRWDAGELMSVADRGRHLLVELPTAADRGADRRIDRALDALLLRGVTPIVSRPERDERLRTSHERLRDLTARGCLTLASAAALVGAEGPERRRAVDRWLDDRLIHCVGSIARDARARRPRLRRAFELTAARAGFDVACRLFYLHPLRIEQGVEAPVTRSAPSVVVGPAPSLQRKAA